MQAYKTPGVYVEEISTLPASVAPVATAIPAFVGYTEKATSNNVTNNIINVPTRITSLTEFEEAFGGAPSEEDLRVTFYDSVSSADPSTVLARNVEVDFDGDRLPYRLYHAVQMYFINGGGPCWVNSVDLYDTDGSGTDPLIDDALLIAGIQNFAKIDEPTLLVIPEASVLVTVPDPVVSPDVKAGYADYQLVMQTALDQCNLLKDRFTIFDVVDTGRLDADMNDFRDDGTGTSYLSYGSSYYPYLTTTLSYSYDEANVSVVRMVSTDGGSYVSTPFPMASDLLDLIDPPSGTPAQTEAYNQALAALDNYRVVLPPSSSMAGIYARTDRDRGVWKAPANVSVSGIVGPSETITAAQQENLNVDPTAGKSINAIRTFTGKGTLVWGARTLAGNDNEWRYVSVRRLFIFVEESIAKATEATVFEANDSRTWLRVKAQIESFLNQQWSAGALAGSTPEQAYFVNVGLGVTMTAQDILEGRMIVDIGMAAVRPAEFIILRFTHKLQEA